MTIVGGGSGIRTPGTLTGTSVFKTDAIDRSAKPPFFSTLKHPLAFSRGKDKRVFNSSKHLGVFLLNY